MALPNGTHEDRDFSEAGWAEWRGRSTEAQREIARRLVDLETAVESLKTRAWWIAGAATVAGPIALVLARKVFGL